MLGKTNITQLDEGGIVTDVKDFSWIRAQSGTYADITKAIFQNGCLAVLTADGSVLYTRDGELWEELELQYKESKINDIDWDGSRFVIVGSCGDSGGNRDATTGLIITTTDFQLIEKAPAVEYSQGIYYLEYYLVLPQNGRYLLIAHQDRYLRRLTVDAGTYEVLNTELISILNQMTDPAFSICSCAKIVDWALIYVIVSGIQSAVMKHIHKIFRVTGTEARDLNMFANISLSSPVAAIFECKACLYIQHMLSENNYALYRITDSNEKLTCTTGQDFAFVAGVYFNKEQLFVNKHEMLILRSDEKLVDKTVDDLMEIAAEDMITNIVKAFGQLYILGKRGLILRSSVEAGKEDTILLQTLSAKKALAEAKQYADAKYKDLEARIVNLEALHENVSFGEEN